MVVRGPRPVRAAAWLGAALLAAGGAEAAAEAAAARGCPAEPLRRLEGGGYARLGGNLTSCAEFSPGCPYSVPVPDFPCLVNCIASSADCVQMNRKTPSVAPSAPWSCSTCSITACKACVYDQSGEARCARCFDGFRGRGGEKGLWTTCELWHVEILLVTSEVLVGIIALLLVLAMVTTCVGAWHKDPLRWLSLEHHHPVQGLESPLVDSLKMNKDAIGQGLRLSFMSSIKYSSMRLSTPKEEAEDRTQSAHRWKAMTGNDLDKQLVDIGLGLQLFFNTQRFLICMAFVTWLAAVAMAAGPSGSAELLGHGSCHFALEASLRLNESQLERARIQGNGCLYLWAVLLVMAWCFHCYQMRFVDSYDKCTHTAEDYTVRLEGLPPSMTSERELKRLLEEELRMEGLIHGVCICYNVLALPEPECIEGMVDRITELDDLDLELYGEHLSTPRDVLLEQLANDSKQLQTWLNDGTLQGSGTAYVVFRKQRDVARLTSERRGIARKVFEKPTDTAEDSDEDCDDFELKVVEITKDNSEPSGVRFENFSQPRQQHRRNEYLWIPLRMVVYIALYAGAAHLYFLYMIKPWEDNFIVGAESNLGVTVGGKLVLLFNFGIQTLVMVDVERGGFLRTAEVDAITFVWNTALLLVTNFYVIVQEVYRDGYRWVLTPPASCLAGGQPPEYCWEWLRLLFQSVTTEREVGRNLVSVLTDQIMMLYVMGEVANVLMPVIFYWVALRLIFVMKVGGSTDSWFQRTLRAMLPSSASATTITAREAEKAQILMPLLLWMEYTYIVIFPAMALVTFYLVTDDTSTVCLWLLIFSMIHYIWQRYVMLWLYGKATYDSSLSYEAFILMWGLVLSMLPPASIWWAYRRGDIQEPAFAMISMALVFMLVLMVYRYGLLIISWCFGSRDDGIDDLAGGDPCYSSIVDRFGISWWNRNPVYVLKHRHCPELPGHEVHDSEVQCWPVGCPREGFFELGKEFRHLAHASEEFANGSASFQAFRQKLYNEGKQLRGALKRSWTASAAGSGAAGQAAPEAAKDEERREQASPSEAAAPSGAAPRPPPAAAAAAGPLAPAGGSWPSLGGGAGSARPSFTPSVASQASGNPTPLASHRVLAAGGAGAYATSRQQSLPSASSVRVPVGTLQPQTVQPKQVSLAPAPQLARSLGTRPVSSYPARTMGSMQMPAAARPMQSQPPTGSTLHPAGVVSQSRMR